MDGGDFVNEHRDRRVAENITHPRHDGVVKGTRFGSVKAWHTSAGSDVVAVYDAEAQTIYLPDGWRGVTPAETSILVHEMVHHLQSRAGRKYECAQAREKMAFQAQQRWLAQFGRSLESEFGLDGFTLLVRTNCGP
jgi:hypothetical protein